jgi:hypothetical protein
LDKSCQQKLQALQLKKNSKQTYATELLTNATNDANTVYGMDFAAANSKLETTEQHHASAVSALLTTKTEMEKTHLKASNTFQSSVVKYNNTKKSLASRHVAELARYAAEETRVSTAETSTVQTALLSQAEKTNFANTTKTNSKVQWEFMRFLSDRTIHKKVSCFWAVWPQTCDKSEKMFVDKNKLPKTKLHKSLRIHVFLVFQEK